MRETCRVSHSTAPNMHIPGNMITKKCKVTANKSGPTDHVKNVLDWSRQNSTPPEIPNPSQYFPTRIIRLHQPQPNHIEAKMNLT